MNHLSNHHPLRRALTLLVFGVLASTGCDAEDGSTEENEAREIFEEDYDLDEELTESEGEMDAEGEGPRNQGPQAFDADQDPLGDAVYRFQGNHSEETFGVSQCPINEVVTGFDCSGSYCDNVNIECFQYAGASVSAWGTWSAWFQEDDKDRHECPGGSLMTGIDCSGSYCDNVRIECTSANGLAVSSCSWLPSSGWYSEENPTPFFANSGEAIKGVWCNGTHCDNKRFRVCDVD